MTTQWDAQYSDRIPYPDACEYLEAAGDKLFNSELDKTASVLRGLYEDRDFLSNFIVAQLKGEPVPENAYSSQVFVLHKSKYFTLRAVLWEPSKGVSGEELFLYDLPHDHDFSFFTLGYFGPGYRTRVRTYDNESVVGLSGEVVETSEEEVWQLSEKKVVLFEGGRDIHCQLPPEQFSISFNVLQNLGAFGINRRQYEFSSDFKRISRVLNVNPLPLLVKAACAVGGEAVEFVEEIARKAPTGYSRAAALEALVGLDERYLPLAMRDRSAYVREYIAGCERA